MNRSLFALAVADLAALTVSSYSIAGLTVPFVPMHLALTLAALAVWLRYQLATEVYDVPVLVLGAAFGPGGMLFCSLFKPWVWIARAYRLAGATPELGVQDPGKVAETPVGTLNRVLDGRITFPEADQLESLNTTLRFGGLADRRKALEAIVRSFEPRLSPLIAIALTDRDQTIRALAAAASAQISSDVTQKVSEVECKLAQQACSRELALLTIALADHGCSNVLLPQTQRMHICRMTRSYLSGVRDQLRYDAKLSSQLSSALRDIDRQMPAFEPFTAPVRLAELSEAVA